VQGSLKAGTALLCPRSSGKHLPRGRGFQHLFRLPETANRPKMPYARFTVLRRIKRRYAPLLRRGRWCAAACAQGRKDRARAYKTYDNSSFSATEIQTREIPVREGSRQLHAARRPRSGREGKGSGKGRSTEEQRKARPATGGTQRGMEVYPAATRRRRSGREKGTGWVLPGTHVSDSHASTKFRRVVVA